MNKDFVYKRRLLKLANFLSKLSNKRFDYTEWVGHDWKGNANLSCGTKACALGWATTIPSFRKAGLIMRKISDCGSPRGQVCLKGDQINSLSLDYNMLYKATKKIFDLSYSETNLLFFPQSAGGALRGSATAQQVAEHIKKFVSVKYQ